VPSIADQFSAVSHALVPFAVALFFIAWAAWRVCEWRYRAEIDKMKEMAVLSRTEVEHWKDAAARNSSKVTEAAMLLQKKELPAEVKPVLEQLTQASTRVNSDLVELGKANTWPTYTTLLKLGDIKSTTLRTTWASASDKPPEEQ
jgi:hypothetical protein